MCMGEEEGGLGMGGEEAVVDLIPGRGRDEMRIIAAVGRGVGEVDTATGRLPDLRYSRQE